MKKLFVLFTGLILALTLGACARTDDTLSDDTSLLAIDVNPAIEIILDEDDNVLSVALLNEDAEIALSDVELEGLPVDQAIDAINDALIETGYIDVDTDENIINITTSDEARRDEMKEKMENSLNERGIGAAVFGGEMLDEYYDLAEEYDIGVGRARLIARAVEIDGELTFEEALELPHGEIMTILRDEHRQMMDEFIQERRDDAQEMKANMKEMAEERVQEHRNRVDDGEVEDKDYDAIRDDISGRIDQIRNTYRNRINQQRQDAIDWEQTPNDDDTTQDQQYTTIDINPAIELILDEDGNVISVGLLNKDAEILVAELDLVGLAHEEALERILDAAIETGYIDVDSHENIITITHENPELEEDIKAYIEENLKAKGVGAAVFGGEMIDEYFDLAEEYDISVGIARLIARAVEIDEELTFEAAIELSQEEIMTILQESHEEMMEEFIQERRDSAQAIKDELTQNFEDKVENHRQNVDADNLPDFDAIKDNVQDRLDTIRDDYKQRIKDNHEQIVPDYEDYIPNDDNETDTDENSY